MIIFHLYLADEETEAHKGKHEGFPDDSAGKESACNTGDAGDMGSILGSRRSPGGGNGNPPQYSSLKKIPWVEEPGGYNPKSLKESDTTEHAHKNKNVKQFAQGHMSSKLRS